MTLNLHFTASVGAVRLVMEGLPEEMEDAVWEAFNAAGGMVRCSAVNQATGYRRSMLGTSASTAPLDLEFAMDAHSQKAADAVHLRIADLGIDLTVPFRVLAESERPAPRT